jgi:hypothetical protein
MIQLVDYKTEISHALLCKKACDNYAEIQVEYFKGTGIDLLGSVLELMMGSYKYVTSDRTLEPSEPLRRTWLMSIWI